MLIQNFKHSLLTFCISGIGFPISVAELSRCYTGIENYTKFSTLSYQSMIKEHLKNQRIDEARIIFDKIPYPDVYQYTMMITGFARNQRFNHALQLFDRMPVKDVVTWNSIIKGCLDCADLTTARRLFDEMPERNVVSWTTMINGFLQFGRIEVAEGFFYKMPFKDTAAWNSMIYGYCCNGRVEDGLRLFEEMPGRNVISWTSMIRGLDQNGRSEEALVLFRLMVGCGAEVRPTSTTYCCVITACANTSSLYQGVQIHAHVCKLGYSFDAYISAALITFYANCKKMDDSLRIFKEKLHMNVVIWTALVTGYGLNCRHEDALKVFVEMMSVGVLPNQSSFTSALNSCCGLEALDLGREIHTAALKLGLETDVFVGNSLVVMYCGCGNLSDGLAIFKKISKKNIVSWNSVIVGCAQHGLGMWALAFFSQMVRSMVEPDEITFTGLLSACSHSGMLQKGRCLFKYFTENKRVEVKLDHYACMVDILGRSGKLEEAEEFIRNMPVKANSMVWLVLLSACKMHSNIEVAERSAKCITDLDPNCSSPYVLLSNLYASASRWSDVSRVRREMKQKGISKEPGRSWINIKGWRNEFLSGDRSHPSSDKIYQKLDWLGGKLKELGYVPDQRFALHDVEGEQKEEMLSSHSERLAIGFGLICSAEGSALTVMKNLRICGDCHSAIKLIAKVVGRKIIVRDSSRFHHFMDGRCSCGDYW